MLSMRIEKCAKNRLFCSVFQEHMQTMFRYPLIFAKRSTSAAPARRPQRAGRNALAATRPPAHACMHARARGPGEGGARKYSLLQKPYGVKKPLLTTTFENTPS